MGGGACMQCFFCFLARLLTSVSFPGFGLPPPRQKKGPASCLVEAAAEGKFLQGRGVARGGSQHWVFASSRSCSSSEPFQAKRRGGSEEKGAAAGRDPPLGTPLRWRNFPPAAASTRTRLAPFWSAPEAQTDSLDLRPPAESSQGPGFWPMSAGHSPALAVILQAKNVRNGTGPETTSRHWRQPAKCC